LGDASSNWLSAGFTFLGIGASALLALVALPSVTTPGSELQPSVEPWLYTAAIFCTVLCCVFVGLHVGTRKRRKGIAKDIANEMDTMLAGTPEEAPEQSPTAPPSGGPRHHQHPPESDALLDPLIDPDLLDDAMLALEAYRPTLQSLRQELRTARETFARAVVHGAYWRLGEGPPPTKTWKKHRDALGHEPTFQDVIDNVSDAFRHIERITSLRALRWGGKVKKEDSLPEAITAIEAAERAISEKLESANGE